MEGKCVGYVTLNDESQLYVEVLDNHTKRQYTCPQTSTGEIVVACEEGVLSVISETCIMCDNTIGWTNGKGLSCVKYEDVGYCTLF